MRDVVKVFHIMYGRDFATVFNNFPAQRFRSFTKFALKLGHCQHSNHRDILNLLRDEAIICYYVLMVHVCRLVSRASPSYPEREKGSGQKGCTIASG